MKFISLAGFCSLSLVSSSHAAFVGFAADTYQVAAGGETKWVLDLYTCHSTAADVLLNVYDANIGVTGGFGQGSIVHNDLVGGSWCPQFATIPECDSFVTIGGQAGFTNSTSGDPGWGFASCGQLDIPAGAGWFNNNPSNLQGKAGTVAFHDGTSKIAVLIGRFVTTDSSPGAKHLTISASITYNLGLSTPPQFGNATADFLFCPVPSPATLAMILLVAPWAGTRRPRPAARPLLTGAGRCAVGRRSIGSNRRRA